jgi:hypothetical protein
MASISELRHAKIIENLNLLYTNIIAVGKIYIPSIPNLLLANLQNIYTNVFSQQEIVNSLVSPYSFLVDETEVIFKPLNRVLSKLRNAYKATKGVTQVQLENFM